MCMTLQQQIKLPKVQAFKVFTRDEGGFLQSAFLPAFKKGLKYPSNRQIRVNDEDVTFFAFENFKDAVTIARQGRSKWNMVAGKIIALPVTLYEVVTKGQYHVQSEDIQCCDGYYQAFESKEIIVHDTTETRNQFYDAVLSRWIGDFVCRMSQIEKEALRIRIPHLAQVIQ